MEGASSVSVLAFLEDGRGGTGTRQLFGYDRVENLQPGATATVRFTIPPQVLAQPDANGVYFVEPGHYKVVAGDGGALSMKLQLDGPRLPLRGGGHLP